jgi:hypothetical protein
LLSKTAKRGTHRLTLLALLKALPTSALLNKHMSDDIVTRLRKNVNDEYLSYRHVLEAADEIERLRVDRDMWKRTCTKLVGIMLPYSLLMNKTEQKELQIILEEAVKL